jgi:hypothetical protein
MVDGGGAIEAIIKARGATCSRNEWTTVALTLIREDCEARTPGEAMRTRARTAAIRLTVCMALPVAPFRPAWAVAKATEVSDVFEWHLAGRHPVYRI